MGTGKQAFFLFMTALGSRRQFSFGCSTKKAGRRLVGESLPRFCAGIDGSSRCD